jgi:hypothetical protein
MGAEAELAQEQPWQARESRRRACRVTDSRCYLQSSRSGLWSLELGRSIEAGKQQSRRRPQMQQRLQPMPGEAARRSTADCATTSREREGDRDADTAGEEGQRPLELGRVKVLWFWLIDKT